MLMAQPRPLLLDHDVRLDHRDELTSGSLAEGGTVADVRKKLSEKWQPSA